MAEAGSKSGVLPFPPRSSLSLTFLLVLGSAWLASWLLPPSLPTKVPPLSSWQEVDRRLREAVADPAPRVAVVMGDSVVAGTVLKDSVAVSPSSWSLVPLLNREVGPLPGMGFHDLSSPGLLPSDALAIVSRLDHWDPQGKLELVIQLSPRHFSAAYSTTKTAWSLPFLAHSPSLMEGSPLLRPWEVLRDRIGQARGGWGGIREWGRSRISQAPALKELGDAETPSSKKGAGMFQLQVRPHFLEPDLEEENVQHASLLALLARTIARKRPVLFFLTPLNEEALGGMEVQGRIAEVEAALGQKVEDGETVRLVNLDGPVFFAERFSDHCHLTPEGNRILALQLLEVLDVPSPSILPEPDRFAPTAPDFAYVVGGTGEGFGNGTGEQVRFGNAADITVVESGILAIADTGNHLIRRVRVARNMTETWAGSLGQSGAVDGEGEGARFSKPTRVVADGRGGVFVLEAEGTRVRHVDRRGKTRTLPLPEGAASAPLLDLAVHRQTLFLLGPSLGGLLAFPLQKEGVGAPRRVATWGNLGVQNFAVDGLDRLWLTTLEGSVWRLALSPSNRQSEPPALDTATTPLVAAAGAGEAAALVEASVRGEKTVEMKNWRPIQARRILPVGEQGEVLVLDRWQDQTLLWSLDGKDSYARPLVPSRADGSRLVQNDPGMLRNASPAVDSPSGILYWLDARHSYVWLWQPWVRTIGWTPDASTFHRGEIAGKEAPYRVLLVGNSLSQFEVETTARSVRLGFPEKLALRLIRHPSLRAVSVDVLSRSHPGQDLVECLATLMGQPPGSVQMAVVMMDRHSIADIGHKVRRARWNAQGFLDLRQDELRSLPIPADEEAPPEGDGRGLTELARVLGATRSWCESHGVRLVVLDILGINDAEGFGLSLSPQMTPDGVKDPSPVPAMGPLSLTYEECRRAVREVGIPLLDPTPWIARILPTESPIHGVQDDHFRNRAHAVLADFLASRLPSLMDATPRVLPAVNPLPLVPSAPLGELPEALSLRHGVNPDRLSFSTSSGMLEVLVDVTVHSPDASPVTADWKRALWIAGRYAPRASNGMRILFVTFASRDEYGQSAWQSASPVATFSLDRQGIKQASSQAASLLLASDSSPPPWLRQESGKEADRPR